jgi:hypothetical protein
MLVLWQPFFLAIANRCRGGLVSISSGQLARLVLWALPLALTLFAAAQFSTVLDNAVYAVALLASAFGGACLAAWGKYDTIPTAWNPGALTVQGILFVGLPASVVSTLNLKLAVALLLSGVTIAPAYWLGWKTSSKIVGFETGVPLGELYFGFFIGACILLGGL